MHLPTALFALSGLFTAITALPTATDTDVFQSKPFTITMTTSNGVQNLVLIQNGTHGEYVLEATTAAGTPAYYIGSNKKTKGGSPPYHNLFMTLSSGTYGLEAPDAGDNYGHAFSVYGVKNGQQKEWIVDKSGISHKLDAALNSLYACKDHANGKPGIFLKFGTPQSPDLHPPVGCDPTALKPDFDVES